MSPKGAPKIAIVVTFGWKSYQLRAALQQHVLLSRVPHVIDATVLHRVHGWFKTLPKCCDSFLCGKQLTQHTQSSVAFAVQYPGTSVRHGRNGRDHLYVRQMVMDQVGSEELVLKGLQHLCEFGVALFACNQGLHRSPALGEETSRRHRQLHGPVKVCNPSSTHILAVRTQSCLFVRWP